MITAEDQEQLLKLVADYLERDVVCIAIGGAAMMFAGYKSATKDIDLVFSNEDDRKAFVRAIEQLGYGRRALAGIYDEKRKEHEDKPQMYTRGDERFDLFVRSVFGFELSVDLDLVTQRHDFLGKKELTLYVPPVEYIIILKAITGREKDYEDIEAIIKTEKSIDWEKVVELAFQQKDKNTWILVDLEETMQQLKEITFIPGRHFKRIYKALEQK